MNENKKTSTASNAFEAAVLMGAFEAGFEGQDFEATRDYYREGPRMIAGGKDIGRVILTPLTKADHARMRKRDERCGPRPSKLARRCAARARRW